MACESSATDRQPTPAPQPTGNGEQPPMSTPPNGDPGSSSSSSSSSSGSSGTPATPAMDTVPISLTVAGATRTALAVVPKSYDAKRAYPLIIALHPDTKDGATFRAMSKLDDQTGDRAIVVYPDGQGATWNLYAPTEQNPDDQFIAALVADASTRFHIDGTKVFGTGFSSGAFMVSQLACRKSSLFRAISVHSGGAPSEPQDPNATSWPNGFPQCPNQTSGVAALVIHGTNDDIVSVDSGAYAARYWAYVDGCGESTTQTTPAPCQQYGCPAGKAVMYCPVSGLKHELWTEASKTTASFFFGL